MSVSGRVRFTLIVGMNGKFEGAAGEGIAVDSRPPPSRPSTQETVETTNQRGDRLPAASGDIRPRAGTWANSEGGR
jgi:hypothetical protein